MGGLAAALTPRDTVLVSQLFPLSPVQGELHFEALERVFGNANVVVRWVPHEEWSLKAAGVWDPYDTTNHDRLLEHGYTHLLMVQMWGRSSGGPVQVYTGREVAIRKEGIPPRPDDPMANRARLEFRLIDLQRSASAYTLVTSTRISPLATPKDSGGEVHVNLSSQEMALQIATRKGSRRLLRECLRP